MSCDPAGSGCPRKFRGPAGSGRPRKFRGPAGSGRPKKLRGKTLAPVLAEVFCRAFIPLLSCFTGSTVSILMILRLPLFTSDVTVDMFLLPGIWKSPDASLTHNTMRRSISILYRISYIYVFRLKRQHTEQRDKSNETLYRVTIQL